LDAVKNILILHLKSHADPLHATALMFEGRRNRLLQDKENKLLTEEQLIVNQNRLQHSLDTFIQGLDNSNQSEKDGVSVSKKQLLIVIIVLQLIILIGIGIIIYYLKMK